MPWSRDQLAQRAAKELGDGELFRARATTSDS